MVDFIRSFKTGVDAARDAERSKLEINAVFNELSLQLAEATDGKIEIKLLERRDPLAGIQITRRGIVDAGKYSVIAVVPTNGEPEEIIAEWAMADTGYPCTISYSTSVVKCINKEGLEEALAQLLENPTIAKTIQAAISKAGQTPSEGEDSL